MKKALRTSPAELKVQLHNGVCQTLTAVHLHASVLSRKLKKVCPEAAADFGEMERLITQARTELFQVVKE